MAEVLDHNGSVLFGDGGQLQLRHPFAQTIDPQDPLLDGLVPIFENQAAGSDFTRENGGGFVGRWMTLGPFDNENKQGFSRAFAPESELGSPIEMGRSYDGKERPVRWRLPPASAFLIVTSAPFT